MDNSNNTDVPVKLDKSKKTLVKSRSDLMHYTHKTISRLQELEKGKFEDDAFPKTCKQKTSKKRLIRSKSLSIKALNNL